MRGIAAVSGRLTFHDFRHTAYTQMKNAAVQRLDPDIALADVRRIFGHSNSGVDDVYDHPASNGFAGS